MSDERTSKANKRKVWSLCFNIRGEHGGAFPCKAIIAGSLALVSGRSFDLGPLGNWRRTYADLKDWIPPLQVLKLHSSVLFKRLNVFNSRPQPPIGYGTSSSEWMCSSSCLSPSRKLQRLDLMREVPHRFEPCTYTLLPIKHPIDTVREVSQYCLLAFLPELSFSTEQQSSHYTGISPWKLIGFSQGVL